MLYLFRTTVVIFFYFLASVTAWGQQHIQGKVINAAKVPIEGAVIMLVKGEQEEVIQYTQSSATGTFELTVHTPSPDLKLRIQHFDYAIYHQALVFPMSYLNLTLTEQVTALEEIVIKPTPITQRHDTLSYNVDSFALKTDRVLEDVLKRLPGIEVSATGQIKYQGESINRFYVEGLDLMKGRYGAITKAISNQDISRVEVYEDHQPIKMLDGKITTGKPALNIRLKNKVSYAGSAKIGLGVTPFLWDVALSPMFFSKNFQTLASYDTNNVGHALQAKMSNFYSFQEFDTFWYSSATTPFLKIADNANPSLNQNRYLFNTSHLGSLNMVQKLSKGWELAATVYYINENNENKNRQQQTTIQYLNPMENIPQNITYKRTSSSYEAKELFNSTFTLTQNEKQKYVKNTAMVHVSKTKARGNLVLDTPENRIDQKQSTPAYQLQNSLSTVLPITEKNWINFRSLVDFSSTKEDYFASPPSLFNFADPALNDYQTLFQSYENQSFYTKNALSYAWTISPWSFVLDYHFTYKKTHFNSALYGSDTSNWDALGDVYSNDLLYREMSNTLQSKISFKSTRWSFNLNLPLDWTTVSLTDKGHNNKEGKDKLLFSPYFYTQYVASLYWTFKGTINYTSRFTPLDQLYPSYILSELNFNAYKNKILQSHQLSTKVEANFKDPFNGWFAYLNVEYIEQNRPILFTKEIGEQGQQIITTIDKHNTKTTKRSTFSLNKFIEPINTTLKGTVSYSLAKELLLLNQVYNTVHTNQNTYSINLTNTSMDWLNLEYEFTYQQFKNKDFKENNSSKTTHHATLSLIPSQHHSLRTTLEVQQNKIQHQYFDHTFLDLTYRYTFQKRKIDLELSWTNMLNHKLYQQVLVNDIMTHIIAAPIRPSQLLASIRFSF